MFVLFHLPAGTAFRQPENLLNQNIGKLGNSTVIPGDVAWRLYDTYGFPIDLTQLMAEEKNMTIDMEGYEKAKHQSYILSQGKEKSKVATVDLDVHAISELQEKKVPTTDDSFKYRYQADTDPMAEYKFESCNGKLALSYPPISEPP